VLETFYNITGGGISTVTFVTVVSLPSHQVSDAPIQQTVKTSDNMLQYASSMLVHGNFFLNSLSVSEDR